MNEAVDLAALVAKLKEEHAQALEERDLKHAGELSKLTEQINNLTGSLDDIAGICNEGRNVVGLMPHPERASEPVLGSADGVVLLESLLNAAGTRAGAPA